MQRRGLRKLSDDQIEEAIFLFNGGTSINKIAEKFDVTSGAIGHWVKRGKRERNMTNMARYNNIYDFNRYMMEHPVKSENKESYPAYVGRCRARAPKDQKKYSHNKEKGDREASLRREGYDHIILFSLEQAYKLFGVVFMNGHHIDDRHVIYIPQALHRYCSAGRYKEVHRKMVIAALKKEYPALYCSLRGIVKEHENRIL